MMSNKKCYFTLKNLNISKVELFLLTYKDKPPGVDELDGRLIKPVASIIASVF